VQAACPHPTRARSGVTILTSVRVGKGRRSPGRRRIVDRISRATGEDPYGPRGPGTPPALRKAVRSVPPDLDARRREDLDRRAQNGHRTDVRFNCGMFRNGLNPTDLIVLVVVLRCSSG